MKISVIAGHKRCAKEARHRLYSMCSWKVIIQIGDYCFTPPAQGVPLCRACQRLETEMVACWKGLWELNYGIPGQSGWEINAKFSETVNHTLNGLTRLFSLNFVEHHLDQSSSGALDWQHSITSPIFQFSNLLRLLTRFLNKINGKNVEKKTWENVFSTWRDTHAMAILNNNRSRLLGFAGKTGYNGEMKKIVSLPLYFNAHLTSNGSSTSFLWGLFGSREWCFGPGRSDRKLRVINSGSPNWPGSVCQSGNDNFLAKSAPLFCK